MEEFRRMREGQVPMGRMGDAWDVANAAFFLVSDEARYITGQKIVVDRGITSSTGHTQEVHVGYAFQVQSDFTEA